MAGDFWEKSKKIEANTRMAKNKIAAKTIKNLQKILFERPEKLRPPNIN
jgi:hypothetical protein